MYLRVLSKVRQVSVGLLSGFCRRYAKCQLAYPRVFVGGTPIDGGCTFAFCGSRSIVSRCTFAHCGSRFVVSRSAFAFCGGRFDVSSYTFAFCGGISVVSSYTLAIFRRYFNDQLPYLRGFTGGRSMIN